MNDFPTGFTSPKYLSAILCEITTVFGSFNAVCLSPLKNEKENTSKNLSSTNKVCSKNLLSLYDESKLRCEILTACSISGISALAAGAKGIITGAGPVV